MCTDRGGQVCEILFELLEDSGLMSCVSLGKWDGKEEYKQVLSHPSDPKNQENLMEQLNKLSQDGIKMIDGREVKINLFECHYLVEICILLCNNSVSPKENNFFPWCTCHKKLYTWLYMKSKLKKEILYIVFLNFMQCQQTFS